MISRPAYILFFCLIINGSALAQFRSDAYEPILGLESEIDSIYGYYDREMLGGYLNAFPARAGMKPRLSYSRWSIIEFDRSRGTMPVHEVDVPGSLHSLDSIQDIEFVHPSQLQRSISADGTTADLIARDIYGGTRIYWGDNQQMYDSSRYTILLLPWTGSKGVSYHAVQPIVGDLFIAGQNSVVISAQPLTEDFANDTVYLVRFDIEQLRATKPRVASVSEMVFWRRPIPGGSHGGTARVGDYNGDAKTDVVFLRSSEAFVHLGSHPTSLKELAHSFLNDTLLTAGESGFQGVSGPGFAVKTSATVNCDDLLLGVTRNGEDKAMYIFHGSQDFGRSKLGYPDKIINAPLESQGDLDVWGRAFWNAGDMTGSGFDVLCVSSLITLNYTGYYYYDLGAAAVDSIAMFHAFTTGDNNFRVDTADLNGDNRTDLIMSHPLYVSEEDAMYSDKEGVGTIHLIYGSPRIRGKASVNLEKGIPSLRMWPNPATDLVNIEIPSMGSSEVKLVVYDLLGRAVTSVSRGSAAFQLELSHLPKGQYLIALMGDYSTRAVLPLMIQ